MSAAVLMTRSGLIDRWNMQIGDRLQRGEKPRPLAVVKWYSRFRSKSPMIDLRDLRAIVVHDLHKPGEYPKIRVAGYWCQPVDGGIRIGGSSGNRFDKNLALVPRSGARGPRLDASDIPLFRTALVLDARLSADAAKMPAARLPNRLRLPTLWAGFESEIVHSIKGSGPELCGLCHSRGESSAELLRRFRHFHNGLELFPHEWVGGHWHEATVFLADFAGIPRCQIVDCSGGFEALHGFRATCEFDFVSTRFEVRRRSRSSAARELAFAS